MKSAERLEAIKNFTYENVCKGRSLKMPVFEKALQRNDEPFKVAYTEPKVYIGLYPQKQGNTPKLESKMAPSILIVPGTSYAGRFKEQRFDQYKNLRRQPDLMAELSVQWIFCIYDPGKRVKEYAGEAKREDIKDNTEQAIFTLTDWMDELQAYLMGIEIVDGTDLYIMQDSVRWGILSSEGSVEDLRPYYFGMVEAIFGTYVNRKENQRINNLLN